MRSTPVYALATLVAALPAWNATQHRPLLPRPQHVEYGAGNVPLRGLSIRFGSPPAPEDRFASRQLAATLSHVAKSPIEVLERAASGRAIVLYRTGPVDALPQPGEHAGLDSREAYSVSVTPAGIEIRGRSSAGLFYGTQTLLQLVEGTGTDAHLPNVKIQDWPSLAYRGTLVDEGGEAPQPSENEIMRQIDLLARFKANQYYFYNEDAIELEGYPLLNPDGRYSKDQVQRIIAYGRERHIDVIPCLELFGHQHDLFRIELYSHLADFAHGAEFHASDPKVLPLLEDWAGQYSQLFSSPFVHIGFDEAFQIENVAKKQGVTAANLFLEQLKRVSRLFQQRGKTVIIWGDMVAKMPETAAKMPPGIMIAVWHYSPSDPTYKQWLDPVVANSLPFIVVPAVANWNQISPDFDTSFSNIDSLLAAGRKANTMGLMNTIWGDDLQVLMRMSWPGIAYGVAAPWQPEPMDRAEFFLDYARVMYGDEAAPDIAAALDRLTRAETALQKVVGENTQRYFWQDPFTPAASKRAQAHREDFRQIRLVAEEAQQYLYRALARKADSDTLSPLLLAGRLLDYAGIKGLYAAEISEAWQGAGQHPTRAQLLKQLEHRIYNLDQSRIGDFLDTLSTLREAYRESWLAEYTPYRLGAAMARWDAEMEYWRHLQTWFYEVVDNFHDGDELPLIGGSLRPAR